MEIILKNKPTHFIELSFRQGLVCIR